MRLRFLALALVAATTIPSVAATPPSVTVLAARTISGTESYGDGVVVVAGTVTIASGGLLEMTRVQVLTAPGAMLVVEGEMRIDGPTTIRGSAFTIDVSGGDARLDGVDAQGTSLTNEDGRLTLVGTTIAGSTADLIDVTGGALDAHHVSLHDTSVAALRADDAVVTFDDLAIAGTNGYGAVVQGGRFAGTGLSISATVDYGLRADGTELDIADSHFSGHCGAYLSGATHGSVTRTTFDTMDHGLTLYGSGAMSLRDLAFESGSIGLYVVGTTLDAERIDASGAQTGVEAFNATGSLAGGVIATATGIEIDGTGLGPVIRSVDLSGSSVGVRNTTATPVDARLNFWGGEPGSSGASSTDGAVTVDPWLTEAPA